MKIRSITAFLPGLEDLPAAAAMLTGLRQRVSDAGFEVQTVRAALPPLSATPGVSPANLVEVSKRMEATEGIDYLSVGPLRPGDPEAWTGSILELLANSSRVFATALLTDRRGIDLASVHQAARIIHDAAPLEPNGFANLRFAALAQVGPDTPFLPAAYGDGSRCFAVATESADLAVDAFATAKNATDALVRLRGAVEKCGSALAPLMQAKDWEFRGFDFSPAPFPRRADSATAALESLGLPALGRAGSVAAAALLTQAIEDAQIQKAGFSGLFLPVLEDDLLALRAVEGEVNLREILLLSAVCGTGLDTVPLPGDIKAEELAAILLDVAALATRLGKPLTARLMPMPGRSAHDPLSFDFPFFADGAVMDHAGGELHGVLGERSGVLPLRRRGQRPEEST